MSPIMRKLYLAARNAPTTYCLVGLVAVSALRAARILRQWEALESMGLVRLRAEHDDYWAADCDCGSPKCVCPPTYAGDDAEAFGSIGEFCLPRIDSEGYWEASEDWHHGDSCWGHVGYRDVLDWRENAYVLDIMSETIDAFRAAWKDRVHPPKGKGLVA